MSVSYSEIDDDEALPAKAGGFIAPAPEHKKWPGGQGVSNEEAIRILKKSNSGVKPNLNRHAYRTVKRIFDIIASGLGILILLIPSAILCCVICIKSRGAGPFYAQERVGRVYENGDYRLFRMWKFRSMIPHADEMIDELEEKNQADGPLFKIKDDPRVIPGVGSWMRKHSIDELPQLLNVFVGQMSLIGPRPALPKEVLQYDERAKERLRVKPGCGGVWQVSKRSDSSFDEMVTLDLKYINKCSAAYDMSLIFETAKAMVVGEGAY